MSPITITIAILAVLFVAIAIVLTIARLRPHLYKSNDADAVSGDGSVEFITDDGVPYLIKRNSDGSISDDDFKIMTCADLHISSDDSGLTFAVLDRFLRKEKPDLVVLDGDNVVKRTDTVMQEKLKAFFEERKLYWGFVLGNHDSEKKTKDDLEKARRNGTVSTEEQERINLANRKWMFDSLAGGKHCIVSDAWSGVYGVGNCVVNIKNSHGVVQSLYFLDSGDYVPGVKRKGIGSEKRCYGYVRKNQLAVYADSVKVITKENGGIMPKSIAFFHIPLVEFKTAFRLATIGAPCAKRLYGTNYEHVCSSNFNDGAFEAFRTSNTHIVVCGHDHKNDSCIDYKGVKLMYSQGLSYDGAYNRRKKSKFFKFINKIDDKFCCFTDGVSILTVKSDGSVDIGARYAQKEGFFDGLEEYFDSAYLTGTVKSGRGRKEDAQGANND